MPWNDWRPWQQWSLALGVLAAVALLADKEVTNPAYALPDRVARGLGSVIGAMAVGAIVSALFGLVSDWMSRRPRHTESQAISERNTWRTAWRRWPLWVGALLVATTFLPFAFRHSAEQKTSNVLDMLRFSPMTGLAMKVVPGLEEKMTAIFDEMFTGRVTEQEAMSALQPLLRTARIDGLNPSFRRMPDARALDVIATSKAVLEALQRENAEQCASLATSGVVNPDKLTSVERILVNAYSGALFAGFTEGSIARVDRTKMTENEYAMVLSDGGITQEALKDPCAAGVLLMTAIAALPRTEQANAARYVLDQPP